MDFCIILFVVKIQVVCDCNSIARGDCRDLVLDIAEKGSICEKRALHRVLGNRLRRVEGPFLTTVPQQKSTALVRSGKDHDEGAEHRWPTGCILVRFEK